MCVILIKVCVLAYMAHVWFLDNYTHSHTPTHMSLQNCLLCATISHTAHKLCVCCAHFFRPSPSLTCPSIYDSDHRSRATHTHTLLHLAREVRDEGHGKARLRTPPFSLGIHSTLLSVSLYFSGQVLSSRLKSTIRNESSLSLGHQRTHTHASLSWLLG